MEQELFSTAQIAAELEHKSKNPNRDVINISKRLGFTPVATRPREGKNPGGKPEMLWSKEQKDAILADNRKRYNDDNIQEARADVTAGNTDTVAPSTIEPAPVVITLNERANRIRQLQADVQRGIFQIGFELIATKEQVGHGNWSAWLKHEFEWSDRTARYFMACAERFGKRNTYSDLPPSTLKAMLPLPEGEEERFIEEQAAAGRPIETQSARDVQKHVKEFKSARATAKKTAEEPTPDLSNRGEKFSIFGRDMDTPTNNDDVQPVRADVPNDVGNFTIATLEQICALRELVTETNDLQTLKAIHDSLLELAQEFGKVVLLTEAKIGELAQKK